MTPDTMSLHHAIDDRIALLHQKIQAYSPDCSLLAVTKYQDTETTREIIKKGISTIGESRAEGIIAKVNELTDLTYSLHMIGHLQSRKTADICPHVSMIQSVDSLRLASKIHDRADKHNTRCSILLQCNLTEEPQKYGFSKKEVVAAVEHIEATHDGLNLKGLMCMGKQNDNEATRHAFKTLRSLCNQTGLPICSMGMSDDREIALQEGSTLLRIGSYFFAK